MALITAVGFAFEIDLDIGHMRSAAQVVMTYQAVEIKRPGCSGINFIVRDFRNGFQIVAHRKRGIRGSFKSGAFRRIDDHLKLAFVVKRKHLDFHQPYRHHGACTQQQDDNPA